MCAHHACVCVYESSSELPNFRTSESLTRYVPSSMCVILPLPIMPPPAPSVPKACVTIMLYARNFFWPVHLRSHYAVPVTSLEHSIAEEGGGALSIDPSSILDENLASVLSFITVSIVSVLALLFSPMNGVYGGCWVAYVVMFLPICGIVQHGMIQKGGDRYGYFPYLALTLMMCVASYRMAMDLLSTTDEDEGEKEEDIGGSQAQAGTGNTGHSADVSENGSKNASEGVSADVRRRHWGRIVVALALVVVPGAVVACLFGSITGRQVETWRTEETVFRRNLAVDPRDWRSLDDYAGEIYEDGREESEKREEKDGRAMLSRCVY